MSLDMAADSMAKASSHEKVGPGPLWKTPGLQLPAYIQHVANELIKQGKSESQAIQMAVGIIKNWASGTPSGGEKGLQPTTIAAAQKALAEWEAAKAKAHATSIPDSGALEFSYGEKDGMDYIDKAALELAFPANFRKPSGRTNAGTDAPAGGAGIANVGQLRGAIANFQKCPGPQRAAQAARIKSAATRLKANELPWVKTFLAKNAGAPAADATNGK